MKKVSLVLIVSALLLSGCGQETVAEKKPSENPMCISESGLAGGWREAQVTPDAELALDFVLASFNAPADFEEIVSVREQIVSGKNYAIEYKLVNGEVWHTVVYQNLDREFSVTEPPKTGRFCQ